jgi:Zn-dependent protease
LDEKYMIDVLLAFMIIGSFLLAIMLHEWAHAQMAAWLGDYSPRQEGRQTLSLREHLDPVGLLMCVILAFQPIGTPPVGLGWGKPVKPDPWKMRVNANTGVMLVALAGPIFSLLLGLLLAVAARFFLPLVNSYPNFILFHLEQLILTFAVVNIGLAIFNLIPLYPLDGYQILYTLLPSKQAVQFARSAQYGPFIILALFFLLPFLARLSGLGAFPLFRLAYYIWLGGLALASLIAGIPLELSQWFYYL